MITGQIVLNGIDDKDLIIILEVKERHPTLTFSPNNLQPAQGGQQPQRYNNALFTWQQGDGLEAVKEMLRRLTEQKRQ